MLTYQLVSERHSFNFGRSEAVMPTNNRDARSATIGYGRSPERDECDYATLLSHGSTLRAEGLMVDISRMGCCIRSSLSVNKYDRVRILLPVVGDSKATVAWALRGVFGCAFEKPIDEATYPQVLAAIKTGRDSWPTR